MMKKIVVCSVVGSILAIGAFFVLFIIALRQGPSNEVLVDRISQSLMVSPPKLSCMGGIHGREPSVFFMLSGEIPKTADVRILRGWAREENERLFNRLATACQISCAVDGRDELLNYKGDVFDLYMVKTAKGYCILYFGF